MDVVQDQDSAINSMEAGLLKQLLIHHKEMEKKIHVLMTELRESKRQKMEEVEMRELAMNKEMSAVIQAVEQHETQVPIATLPQTSPESGGHSTPPSKPPPGFIFDEAALEKNKAPRGEPVEELVDIRLHPTYQSRTTKVGALLSPNLRKEFENFLLENADVLTWTHEDMPRIDPNLMVHRLNVDPSHKVVQQRRRVFTLERYEVIKLEVEKLRKAGFIEELVYPSWLANVVLVKKSSD